MCACNMTLAEVIIIAEPLHESWKLEIYHERFESRVFIKY